MLYHFDFERNNVKFDKTYRMFKALLTALANTKNRHLKIHYLRKIVSKYPTVTASSTEATGQILPYLKLPYQRF